MQAHDMPFTKLINVDQGAREHFHVPKYQREYTWKKWQWDQLLNDIQDNDPGYFMGSIICVNDAQALSTGDEIVFEVVDGQQRLTTISLLLAAIHAKLTEALPNYHPEDSDDLDEVKSCITNIKAKLIKKKKDPKAGEGGSFTQGKNVYYLRVQPSAQNQNMADYLSLLNDAGIVEGQPKPPWRGIRLLSKAYSFFLERTPDKIPELLNMMERLNQLMFVQITVGSQSDAFALFESLNNRGIPLSAMDIIKNKMLAQMEKKHGVDIDESFDRWQKLVEAIPESSDQERFLRHFYNTFKHQPGIRVDKVTRATRSLIIRIYESLINKNAGYLFDELTKSAELYGRLLKSDFKSKPVASGLTELSRVGSVPGYMVLLYLFSQEEDAFEEHQFLPEVVDLLLKYFVRRNVTDKPPTRQIDQGLIELIESCAARLAKGRKLSLPWFMEELSKSARPASRAEFEAALSDDLYSNNAAMARYVLVQVDQLHNSKEYSPDLWARDEKARFVWTVEHVLPQAEKLPDHWVKMIADGDKHLAAELQEAHVHKLGNLTLSGYNSDLATASFEKKQKLAKDRSFLGQKINIGYQNGLALNAFGFSHGNQTLSLATAPHWNAELIESRTKALVKLVVNANLLPGETPLN